MKRRIELWTVLVLLFHFAQANSRASGATPEEALARINRLPAAEREAALIKEAKNEKTVIWYAPMNREDLRQFTAGFEAEYPLFTSKFSPGARRVCSIAFSPSVARAKTISIR
jgi:hypothetical protein